MKGVKGAPITLLFLAASVFCLLSSTKSAAVCPAPFLPADVLPTVSYNYTEAPFAKSLLQLHQEIPMLFREGQIDVYAVAVVHRNGTILTSGLTSTHFRIGSITKVFTAMGALMLRKRGVLTLDDPVKKFLPTFSVINPYGEHDITLRELMGHLSGLPRELCTNIINCGELESESEVLESIAKMQLARPPWSFLPTYSNLGFGILGHAWEKATSPTQSWSAFINDEVFVPLTMNASGVDLAHVHLAPGHIGGEPSNTSIGWLGPAGEMFSTALDLAKFLKFMLKPGPELLSDTEIREWIHPTAILPDTCKMGFALPWEIIPAKTSTNSTVSLITKSGALGTYRSIIAFHPETELGVVVLMSSTKSNSTSSFTPTDVVLPIFANLIPAVQSVNSKIISSLYSYIYECDRTEPILSPDMVNATIQVLGGNVNVTIISPEKGLIAQLNITLLINGLEYPQSASVSLVLKNELGGSDSFWAYPGTCSSIAESLSGFPEIFHPNLPGSVDLLEFQFDPSTGTFRWPSTGAVCHKKIQLDMVNDH